MKIMSEMKMWIGGAVLAMATLAMSPMASATNIDGINLPAGSGGFSTFFWEQNPVTLPPTSFNGFGYFTGLGTQGNESYCATSGCVLTYNFGGFTLDGTPTTVGATTIANYTGGWVNVFINTTSNFDTSTPDPTSVDTNTSTNAGLTPFLTLLVSGDLTTTTTSGITTFSGILNTTDTPGGGVGTPGVANPYILSTVVFCTSPEICFSGSTPSGSSNLDGYFTGTANGNFVAVPEPGDLGMMGLGLLMVGLLGLRVRQSRFRRT